MTKAQADGQDVSPCRRQDRSALRHADRRTRNWFTTPLAPWAPSSPCAPIAKSPAASKHVEFVLASMQTAEQIAAKCKIPTIVEEVNVDILLRASAAPKPAVGAASRPRPGGRHPPRPNRLRLIRPRLLTPALAPSPPRRRISCGWKPDASTTCSTSSAN